MALVGLGDRLVGVQPEAAVVLFPDI